MRVIAPAATVVQSQPRPQQCPLLVAVVFALYMVQIAVRALYTPPSLLPPTKSGLVSWATERFAAFSLPLIIALLFNRQAFVASLRFRWRFILFGVFYVLIELPLNAAVGIALGHKAELGAVDTMPFHDPVYLALAIPLVAFGTAGLREELWRAGFLTALDRLSPSSSLRKAVVIVTLSAFFFGVAHAHVGLPGILQAASLGAFMGIVQTIHRSVWPAVICHALVDTLVFLRNGLM